ncbi:MAG: hypothetical protein QM811_03950 [Pirellulales bacterium]
MVIRPDSGDPPTVVVQVLEILGRRFGYTTNVHGFRVLDPHVRLIQGDGIDKDMLGTILEAMRVAQWSADNIAFGSGGGLLQKINRDTSKYAFKCSSATVNGVPRDVFKQPATDGGKRSKRGRLKLIRRGERYETVRESESDEADCLIETFLDGEIVDRPSWTSICERASIDVR